MRRTSPATSALGSGRLEDVAPDFAELLRQPEKDAMAPVHRVVPAEGAYSEAVGHASKETAT
jgi:hypothetical protein